MVYLVGAGPGDPGLTTVRAMELIRTADVILYDRLIDPVLLCDARPDCELIDVGKSAGDHSVPQGKTTELLVRHGATGRTVVRLKGGDPFLFGRGGEEAEELARNNIPFAVVPGVSALLAATASAGIPLTHRDFASSVAAATGHAADGKDTDPVRWRELARAADTIVVFMGVGNLAAITGELIAGGMAGTTPAALVERGGTPRQRVITATLSTITGTAHTEHVKPPALLVVGPTVPLTHTIGWYRPGPLAGLRIGVTRPLAQSKSFADRLRSLGAAPVLMPTIMTADTIGTPEVHDAIGRLRKYDYVVFSSTNGVGSFFRALIAHGFDARALAGARIACIGPVTAGALEPFGVRADIIAERYIAEGLAESLAAGEPVAGKSFLLTGSNIGRTALRDELTAAGAHVDHISFYTTGTVALTEYARSMVKRSDLDIITFTSSSTVRGFFGHLPAAELPGSTRIASIGPETTKTLHSFGITPDIEAPVYTTEGLAAAIMGACDGAAG